MLSEGAEAATAAFSVGYESPSQFSREYARLFGAPPRRDVEALKPQGGLPGAHGQTARRRPQDRLSKSLRLAAADRPCHNHRRELLGVALMTAAPRLPVDSHRQHTRKSLTQKAACLCLGKEVGAGFERTRERKRVEPGAFRSSRRQRRAHAELAGTPRGVAHCLNLGNRSCAETRPPPDRTRTRAVTSGQSQRQRLKVPSAFASRTGPHRTNAGLLEHPSPAVGRDFR